MMKVLLVGRWGKTHAVAMGLKRNSKLKLYTLMDKENGSLVKLSDDYKLGNIKDKEEIERYALEKKVDMVVVTPEMSLKTGVIDDLRAKGIPAVGAGKTSSILEGDKVFLRRLLQNHNFDAAVDFRVFEDKQKARRYLMESDLEYAIKPAGVTEGDGVKVMGKQLDNKEEALEYIDHIFDLCVGGLPHLIIEEKLDGEEFTLQTFSDGKSLTTMPAVRDYKMLYEGERGLNTPGMGSYSDANHLLPFLSRTTYEKAVDTLRKILYIMEQENGAIYKGFLTGQFMMTEKGVKLIEINARPGDAEILNIIPLLETDLAEICMSIANGTLHKLPVSYKQKATVCKYVVPPGFPTPGKKPVKLEIDKKAIERKGGTLYQSCFDVGENLYEPSPRLFAVTTTADDIESANEKCEECLEYIRGKDLYHRKDIGTKKLMEHYYGNQRSIS